MATGPRPSLSDPELLHVPLLHISLLGNTLMWLRSKEVKMPLRPLDCCLCYLCSPQSPAFCKQPHHSFGSYKACATLRTPDLFSMGLLCCFKWTARQISLILFIGSLIGEPMDRIETFHSWLCPNVQSIEGILHLGSVFSPIHRFSQCHSYWTMCISFLTWSSGQMFKSRKPKTKLCDCSHWEGPTLLVLWLNPLKIPTSTFCSLCFPPPCSPISWKSDASQSLWPADQ